MLFRLRSRGWASGCRRCRMRPRHACSSPAPESTYCRRSEPRALRIPGFVRQASQQGSRAKMSGHCSTASISAPSCGAELDTPHCRDHGSNSSSSAAPAAGGAWSSCSRPERALMSTSCSSGTSAVKSFSRRIALRVLRLWRCLMSHDHSISWLEFHNMLSRLATTARAFFLGSAARARSASIQWP